MPRMNPAHPQSMDSNAVSKAILFRSIFAESRDQVDAFVALLDHHFIVRRHSWADFVAVDWVGCLAHWKKYE